MAIEERIAQIIEASATADEASRRVVQRLRSSGVLSESSQVRNAVGRTWAFVHAVRDLDGTDRMGILALFLEAVEDTFGEAALAAIRNEIQGRLDRGSW